MNLKFSAYIFGIFFLLTSSQIFAATEKFNLQIKNPEKSEIIKTTALLFITFAKNFNASNKFVLFEFKLVETIVFIILQM